MPNKKNYNITIKYMNFDDHLKVEDIQADGYEIDEKIDFFIIRNSELIDENNDKYLFEDRYIRLNRIKEFSIRYEN